MALFGWPMSKLLTLRSCAYTLTFALGMSALGAGAVHLPVLVAYAGLLLIAGVLGALSKEAETSAHWSEKLGVWLCISMSALCLLQALPLPVAWLESLAPRNADIWARARRLFEEPPPGFEPLSLAPQRSLVEGLKYSSYALVFALSARLSRKFGAHRTMAAVFGLSTLVAVVTAIHQVTGAERLYGVYTPLNAYSVAPLLNANNRAGFLNLGFFCGLGVMFRAGTRPYAALVGVALAFLAAEILLCHSLGGSLALGLGLVAVVVVRRGGQSSGGGAELGRWWQGAILLSVAVGAVLMAFTASHSPLGLDDRSVEKLDLLSAAARMAFDYPWFGVGRGAFGSVFPVYERHAGHVVSEHAENFPLQWASEWGMAAGIAALIGMIALCAGLFTRRALQSPSRRCALVGCVVVLLQNLVDLGLEVPAVAALLFCVLGSASGASTRTGKPKPDQPSPGSRSVWPWAAPLLCSVCLVLVLVRGVESPARLRHDLHAELSSSSKAPKPRFWVDLERAMSAYPAEPYFPLLASSAALAAGKNPLPWISRALERNPTSAEAHIQLARILRAHHHDSQALGALRRAIELEPRRARTLPRLATAWQLSDAELEQTVPDGPTGALLLVLLAGRSKVRAERVRLLQKAIERDPNEKEAHYQLAGELWAELAGKVPQPTCTASREACFARAEEHARLAHDPKSARSDILQARLVAERGDSRAAEELVAKACGRFPSDPSCSETLVSLALDNKSPRLNDAVNALVAAACVNSERCGKAHLNLGRRFTHAGELGTAMSHFRRAAEQDPTHQTLSELARAADRLGAEVLARDARRRLELLDKPDSKAGPPSGTEPSPPSDHPLPPGAEHAGSD